MNKKLTLESTRVFDTVEPSDMRPWLVMLFIISLALLAWFISRCVRTVHFLVDKRQLASFLNARIKAMLLVAVAIACSSSTSAASTSETYQTVVQEVMVPMRDGARLATDVYLPTKNGKPLPRKLPAVLMRTPYNKSSWAPRARFFAEHGYLSVLQDCRGRYKSEGRFFPFVDEPQDGYDTIAWLAKHPSCNGKVGMHGVSHMAWVQLEAATQNPPALVTIIPHQGPINAYGYSMRGGGALHLGLLRWILSVAATSPQAQRRSSGCPTGPCHDGAGPFLALGRAHPLAAGQNAAGPAA